MKEFKHTSTHIHPDASLYCARIKSLYDSLPQLTNKSSNDTVYRPLTNERVQTYVYSYACIASQQHLFLQSVNTTNNPLRRSILCAYDSSLQLTDKSSNNDTGIDHITNKRARTHVYLYKYSDVSLHTETS